MKVRDSIANLSLKRRIWIAICLVSLLPVIVLIYYFFGYYISLWASGVLIFVILLGWRVIFEVFSSISKVYAHSKTTLQYIGEEAPAIPDEVQSLEAVINVLSEKVKGGFEQLKEFTHRTEELNREVTKKVLVLSAILQANDLFSKEAPAEEVIRFLSNHLKDILDAQACFCTLRKELGGKIYIIANSGIDAETIQDFTVKRSKELLAKRQLVVIDSQNQFKNYQEWSEDLNLRNLAISPILSKGQVIGIVGVGNNDDNYSFSQDALDVLNLFSQNVTLIWEHQRLSSKIEDLEILDDLTGLYNEKALAKRLGEEIERATAYQRPCGFIVATLVNYTFYQEKYGLIEAERILKRIANGFKKALRPIDIAGRIGPNMLGAILIETNKRQSQEIADRLKKDLTPLCQGKIELVFSVAESPLNGISAEELIQFVQKQPKA